ncbi:virulence factor SrfB [Pantoea phytobeneficialis]|uniref:Virulence factor SrfB n=1 Tax=Pantoea phytobeneficialis TaxID=2052056 RepID=A0AAP9KP56_9GAMM|nr:virulence factor SrfB [Pantoea phytobeneficialis]MDO6406072.1 virulence factor SrfB [Pantoea phytobeneficialis]QGR06611.1 virulence factor SrfB [Pantoea phytobeneficialis]
MLAPLIDDKQRITLIEDSGVQFLDFGLRLPSLQARRQFVRQTANGPLLRLNIDGNSGKFLLYPEDGSAPEVVRPESDIALADSLTLLANQWLPLPVLRCTSGRRFIGGPENWARLRLAPLSQPDAAGNTHRITLAFDTRLVAENDGGEQLGLSQADAQNGVSFALAWHNYELGEFLDLTWVDGWLRETFSQQVTALESRREQELVQALREFEYQAHYLNVLELLGEQLDLAEIAIQAASLQSPAVNVDIILDVGNSHTCGILVEDHAEESNGLRQTYELQLRDLSEPHQVYNELFDSRLEFAEPRFGKANFSLESGRENAFMWPSLTRVGREASRLALLRAGTEGSTGLSSPRRYLWDEARYQPGWRFNANGSGDETQATALPFTLLLNDEGQPLHALAEDERLPVFSASYSRSSLMTFMLCELLAQAMMQMNSVAQRQRMPQSQAPRQLRHVILTLPSAMPKPEREIFRRRMQEAIALVWKAEGWHPAEDAFSAATLAKSLRPVPDVQMEWDEATCGQMVWLFNETQVNFAGRAEDFFTSMARPDRPRDADELPGKSLRIASIDIGGGTTDLAITQYRLDDGQGNNVKITPRLLFREGFKVAGDDILLDVIQLWVLPALQQSLQKAGLTLPEPLMNKLFGHDSRMDGQATLRQQVTLQLFIPLAQAVLERYENWDPLDSYSEINALFGELVPQKPSNAVLAFINGEIQRTLGGDSRFDLLEVPLVVSLAQLHGEFLQHRMAIIPALRAMCEVVSLYQCDVLLLTGRPSRFPGIQALVRHLQPLPGSRILSLEGYHTSDWYPFNKQGRIDNPKSTAAVGAMLCLLALDLRLSSFWFRAGDFEPYSTIRYLGVLDETQALSDDNLCYSEIDLDSHSFALDRKSSFRIRGNVCLGFRQLENDRWPASPLYSLSIIDPQLARKVAGESVLRIKLAVQPGPDNAGPERLVLSDARLDDGSRVPLEQLSLKLNTLSATGNANAQYWIDSGSVCKK